MLSRCWLQGRCECEPRSPVAAAPESSVKGSLFGGASSISSLLEALDVDRTTRSVVLKLNLCEYRDFTSGATTSPVVVTAIIEALRHRCDALDRIVLLECDSSGTRAEDLYALLGFTDLADELGLELFVPASAIWREVDRIGDLPMELPEVVYDVDLFVNVPKMKLHGKTVFTGALKNNFGLVRRKWKLPYHGRLCETIVASNLHLPPQLCLMDGSITLSGRGPAYGVPVETGIVLGSWDPVAIDAAGARLSHVPAAVVGHIRMARRAGLGHADHSLEWLGEEPDSFDVRVDWLRIGLANALRKS